ncbi:MAG TPA: hypothetical protein VKA68_12805 [bacterium]|nr:hypothetical protein [bacterium]
MKKICRYLLVILLGVTTSLLRAQSDAPQVQLLRSPDEFSILYISDLIEDPASAPIIFQISLVPPAGTTDLEISVSVSFSADIPSLEISNTQIFSILTEPFELKGPITISNRDLADRSNVIFTDDGQPISIRANRENLEHISGEQKEKLINALLTNATVPPGVYSFRYVVYSEDGRFEPPLSDEFVSEVDTPPNLQVIAPPDKAVIQTAYPVFQWESIGAQRGCNYSIRISEWDLTRHGSPEEALQDDSNLPYPDNGGYEELTDATSFQYPVTGVKPLEEGKRYVWQVRKNCVTTRGEEVIESEIYTFMIGGERIDPVQLALESLLGRERYERLFGAGGELTGYFVVSGTIRLNGRVLSISELMNLANRFRNNEHQIRQMQVTEQ